MTLGKWLKKAWDEHYGFTKEHPGQFKYVDEKTRRSKWIPLPIYKELMCSHNFECVHDVMSADAVPWFKCTKCGKEEGL